MYHKIYQLKCCFSQKKKDKIRLLIKGDHLPSKKYFRNHCAGVLFCLLFVSALSPGSVFCNTHKCIVSCERKEEKRREGETGTFGGRKAKVFS